MHGPGRKTRPFSCTPDFACQRHEGFPATGCGGRRLRRTLGKPRNPLRLAPLLATRTATAGPGRPMCLPPRTVYPTVFQRRGAATDRRLENRFCTLPVMATPTCYISVAQVPNQGSLVSRSSPSTATQTLAPPTQKPILLLLITRP
jgi:hypothetical protein